MVNPLRTIAVNNRLFSSTDSNATRRFFGFRTPYTIVDANSIVISLYHWGFTGAGFFTPTNTYGIVDMSIELGGNWKAVSLGGNRNKTMAILEEDYQSVTIVPSDFPPLMSFAIGTQVWLKGRGTVPVNGNSLPVNSHMSTSAVSGSQFFWYDEAATTISSTDATGAYTLVSGAALFQRSFLFAPMLFGQPVNDNSKGMDGDSTGAGLTDNSAYANGQGYFARMMYGAGGSDIMAGLNLSVGGTNSTQYLGRSQVRALRKYARDWGFSHAANDFSTAGTLTGPQMITRMQSWAAEIDTDAPTAKKFVVPALARTTSTDSFATTANQTTVAGWGTGGNVATYETLLAAEVGVTIDLVLPTLACRDTTDNRKWLVNGAAAYATGDGLHAKEPATSAMATVMAPLIRAI